jgi:hypothetical protein
MNIIILIDFRKMSNFKTVSRRHFERTKSSLSLKKQWADHHYYINIDITLFRTLSHVIIMATKSEEKRDRDLTKESSIRVIDTHRDSGKARLILITEIA